MTCILYIHGFLSSPLSKKAQLTQAWLAQHYPQVTYLCPSLSSYPDEAEKALLQVLEPYSASEVYVIGSSLGGFWATYLIERKRAAKAVLVNPAVAPQQRFHEFIGKDLQSYYSPDIYRLTPHHLHTLNACDVTQITQPKRYWVLLQTGDEVLDYRLAADKYHACAQQVEEGGDHSFVGYKEMLPAISEFFRL